jgi:hypothetical protein
VARSPVAVHVVGRAALDPRDREDARRGHPAADLTAFARARGLEPLGRLNPSGYTGALPMEPELQSDVVRGPATPARAAAGAARGGARVRPHARAGG